MVMMEAVRIFLEAGHDIEMISMADGELRNDVKALGIPVSLRKEFMEDWKSFLYYAWSFDLVLVNTIVPLQTIHLLNQTHIKTIWWIHEPQVYFDVYKEWLPDMSKLNPNIHLWAVSPVVADTINDNYGIRPPIVPFGIYDAYKGETLIKATNTVTFLTVGIFCKRKGQDLILKAADAIGPLTDVSVEFLFCGNTKDVEPDIYEPIKRAAQASSGPDSVDIKTLPETDHTHMLEIIAEADYLLIPSRAEPMPTVAAEGLMMGTPSIISDICGMSKYIKDRKHGFVFESENIDDMVRAIKEAIKLRHPGSEEYRKMVSAGRQLYIENFSCKHFRDELLNVLEG